MQISLQFFTAAVEEPSLVDPVVWSHTKKTIISVPTY